MVGNNCSLNPFAILYGHGGLCIGNRVRIAAHAVLIPANHRFRSPDPLDQSGVEARGITVGDDVWIGSGARILDGVALGDRSVIGAGAVVTRTVPTNCIATGIPARVRSYTFDGDAAPHGYQV